ncbi:hypothetical protein GCM10011331_02250 [Flavimobilis marinus]|uniref:Uncharacterized protein n=1 Tax=Flavimobilis marinus TaxID=285351 RepID=A0A1I2DXV5_9MICO|nr:hypothetical protein [Flavimobilis marinus]GHG44113.1 hypothetical protein GCM10011331_02250 [Flavimobilis marinus]SFE85081.1 hypothetical protein SAMN04488035_0781 [Flavimobilis marinus]
MRLQATVGELVALAEAGGPLPELVRSVRAADGVVHVELDPTLIPDAPSLLRWAAAAAGTVSVAVRVEGLRGGEAVLDVEAHVRGLPAHKLLPYLIGPVRSALRARGLPEHLVDVRREEAGPRVVVAVQEALNLKTTGIHLAALTLQDDTLQATVTLTPPLTF